MDVELEEALDFEVAEHELELFEDGEGVNTKSSDLEEDKNNHDDILETNGDNKEQQEENEENKVTDEGQLSRSESKSPSIKENKTKDDKSSNGEKSGTEEKPKKKFIPITFDGFKKNEEEKDEKKDSISLDSIIAMSSTKTVDEGPPGEDPWVQKEPSPTKFPPPTQVTGPNQFATMYNQSNAPPYVNATSNNSQPYQQATNYVAPNVMQYGNNAYNPMNAGMYGMNQYQANTSYAVPPFQSMPSQSTYPPPIGTSVQPANVSVPPPNLYQGQYMSGYQNSYSNSAYSQSYPAVPTVTTHSMAQYNVAKKTAAEENAAKMLVFQQKEMENNIKSIFNEAENKAMKDNKSLIINNVPSHCKDKFSKVLKSIYDIRKIIELQEGKITRLVVRFKQYTDAEKAFRVLLMLLLKIDGVDTKLKMLYLKHAELVKHSSDLQKADDIKVMAEMTCSLKKHNILFSWDTSSFSYAATKTDTKPVFKSSNRVNLISVRIGASAAAHIKNSLTETKSISESPSMKIVSAVEARQSATMRDAFDLIERRKQEIPKDSKSIVENIKRLNDLKASTQQKLDTQIERIYEKDTEEHRQLHDLHQEMGTSTTISHKHFAIRLLTSHFPLVKECSKIIKHIFNASDYNKTTHCFVFRTKDDLGPRLMMEVLPEMRFLDGYMTVDSVGIPLSTSFVTNTNINKTKSKLQKAINIQNEAIFQVIRNALRKCQDAYNYKLTACNFGKMCKLEYCSKTHCKAEIRRNPSVIDYEPSMCPNATACRESHLCKFSHNYYEVMMHPLVYPKLVCDTVCTDNCFNAHVGTPEMFYRSEWQDLYVTKLHNTFIYLAGAVRFLYKLKEKIEVPILLVSLSLDVVKICARVVSVVNTFNPKRKVQVGTILCGDENPIGCHVIVGHLPALLSLLKTKGVEPLSRLKVLIIDDLPSMIKDKDILQKMVTLLLMIQSAVKEPTKLQKIVTAEEYNHKHQAVANEVLSTNLQLVDGNEGRLRISVDCGESQDSQASDTKPVSLPVTVSSFVPVEASSSASLVSNVNMSSDEVIVLDRSPQETVRRISPEKRSASPHESIIVAAKRQRIIPEENGTPTYINSKTAESVPQKPAVKLDPKKFMQEKTELQNNLDDNYKVYYDMPEMHPNYEAILEEFESLFYRPPEGETDDIWVNFYQKELSKYRNTEWEIIKAELVKKHKYGGVSPAQEDKKKENSASIHEATALRNESYQASTSKKYEAKSVSSYQSTSTSVYESPKNNFESSSRRYEASNSRGSESSSRSYNISDKSHVASKRPSTESYDGDINLEEAFEILDDLSPKLGIIGVSLKEVVKDAKIAGGYGPEALKVFANKNNHAILSLAIDKMNDFKEECSLSLQIVVKRGLFLANAILTKIKGKPSNPDIKNFITDESDLTEVAKQTLGKSPTEIVNVIKQSIEKKNLDNTSMINDIFMKISGIHFRLATMEAEEKMEVPEPTPVNWFVEKVKLLVADEHLTMDSFNDQLGEIFNNKPPNYSFSSEDIKLANELQQLAEFNLTDNMFIFAIRKIMENF